MWYDMSKFNELSAEMVDELGKFSTYLSDTSIRLEDRWHSYEEAVRKEFLTATKSYGDGYITLLGLDNPYDDLGMERHETSTFPEILDMIEHEQGISDEQVAAWKEKVLASGYASFTFDW